MTTLQARAEAAADAVRELADMLDLVTPEQGTVVFDHTPEEIGLHVMENYQAIRAALFAPISDALQSEGWRVAGGARECPLSALPSGKHQVDTSMESGPNNCFFCEEPMPLTAPPEGEGV